MDMSLKGRVFMNDPVTIDEIGSNPLSSTIVI
jgi:hypothetical protein